MTPTVVENGKLFMVVGTPGGSTIITSVYKPY
jgi:gamma-glutamyltranspeptidase/glutathione hydrolase